MIVTGAVLLLFTLSVSAGPAAADRPFTPRFSQNVTGALTMPSNTILTCAASESNCAAAQAGTATPASALNNNNHAMVFVDVDDDPATFNSSTADLSLPGGSDVLFAGLYFGARTTAGSGGVAAPNTAQRGTVRFTTPGGSSQTLTATTLDDSTTVTGAYSGFTDITSQVATARDGSYTVADIQAGTGLDRYGGWAMVVAYQADAAPPRNLTVFDGLQDVRQGDPPVTVPVSGFQTPPTGPVETELGFVAFEGDRGASGDSASLNGQTLSDASNPANNFFNSSISRDGVPVTTKNPNYDNQLGFDAIETNADGILGNGDSSAAIGLRTNLDQYFTSAISFATNLFAPKITLDKTVSNATDPGAPVQPGDVLRYAITATNTGEDGAAGFSVLDSIPGDTGYVDGSLRLTTGPDSPLDPTDVTGDDLGEYDAGPRAVRMRLGQGANASGGGLIAPGVSSTFTFDVKVGKNVTEGTEITNVAKSEFTAQTAGFPIQAESPPVSVTVARADPNPPDSGKTSVSVDQSVSDPTVKAGGKVKIRVKIKNRGKFTAKNVKVCQNLPSGLVLVRAPGAKLSRGRVCWTIPALKKGKTRKLTVTARAANLPRGRRLVVTTTVSGKNIRTRSSRTAIKLLPGRSAAGGVTG